MVPAIAVADALRAEGATVVFVGGERAEAELVPAAGYPLERIAVEGISRSNPLKAARAMGRAAAAVRRARQILREHRADAVMGGGGYVAGPVGLAAVRSGIPLVLTEADSHMGLTNRLLAGRARRVCLAFPIDGRDGERYRVTGRPVPARDPDRGGARAQFGFAPDDTVVLVFGGSLGARSINHTAPVAFSEVPFKVLHIAGRRDFGDLSSPGEHYVLLENVQPFTRALAAADAAVARAGGSIFELAQHGLPAVLVPYPHATGDHQTSNARWMAEAGAARILPDADLTPERLREETEAILANRADMAAAARRIARPDAAKDIAAIVLAAATG